MEPLQIMIVDDEEGMRMGVSRALRDFVIPLPDLQGEEVGFVVTQAASGEDAIAAIKKNRPDILLLDHKMEGMTGLEVLKEIGGEDGGILTIMITAYASLETAITATKRGAYDFLPKPFTPNELRTTVSKATKHLVLARQARKLAEEKRQVRFQFISVLAHELKAPLAAIEGFLDIMHDKTAGDDPAAYDHMIDRCLIRLDGMKKLIFDLLDMTRIESGQKTRNFAKVDIREVAELAIESFTPEAQKRNIEIILESAGPLELTADRSELEIIFNNLVSNAVKYNRDDGKVTVGISEADDDTIQITVADTGIGMTEEECGRLFEEFSRIKNAKTRNIMGSGLGLSTVKKLAMLYKGDATVKSQPDAGTTFTVTLKKSSVGENLE